MPKAPTRQGRIYSWGHPALAGRRQATPLVLGLRPSAAAPRSCTMPTAVRTTSQPRASAAARPLRPRQLAKATSRWCARGGSARVKGDRLSGGNRAGLPGACRTVAHRPGAHPTQSAAPHPHSPQRPEPALWWTQTCGPSWWPRALARRRRQPHQLAIALAQVHTIRRGQRQRQCRVRTARAQAGLQLLRPQTCLPRRKAHCAELQSRRSSSQSLSCRKAHRTLAPPADSARTAPHKQAEPQSPEQRGARCETHRGSRRCCWRRGCSCAFMRPSRCCAATRR